VLLLVVSAHRVTHPPESRPAPPAQKLVWVAPVPPPAPPQPAPGPAKPKLSAPIAYAAAPMSLGPARDWHDLLPQALALQAKGLAAPSFVVNNLDKDVVTLLVVRHLAILVAGCPPFDHDARQILWRDATATDGGALAAGWTERVARRAIVLPHALVDGISLTGNERVYLLISTDLDAAILAAQLAVADQRHVGLQALARTSGRIVLALGGVEFHIDDVDLSK
jgi:hypothetical protein